MFGFVMEFKPPFNDMAYIQLQYIAIDDYTDPNPKNITDDFHSQWIITVVNQRESFTQGDHTIYTSPMSLPNIILVRRW